MCATLPFVGKGRPRDHRWRRPWLFALIAALFVVSVDGAVVQAQQGGGTAGPGVVWASDQVQIVPVSGPGVVANNGPVYACYFARQFTDAQGMTRQGDQFIQDTTGPELVPGTHYARQCLDDTGAVVDFGVIQYNPGAPVGGVLTEIDIRDHTVASVPIHAAPLTLSPDGRQITAVETWIDQPGPTASPEEFGSAGQVTVGVRARLVRININPGDGSGNFSCTVAELSTWSAGASNPGCSHTYWEQPAGGSYRMTAEYVWDFDWLPFGAAVWELSYATDSEVAVFDVEVDDLEAVISR